MSDVTQILRQMESGDQTAADRLLPLVYEELRKLAAARMARESPDHTLQATALVHEAYLRLVAADEPQQWNGRGHFFGAAAEAMRRILVESARRKQRAKHGGELQRLDLNHVQVPNPLPDEELLALNDALEQLRERDPTKARLVDLRYFAGLTIEQAADVLQISSATAKRHWRYARAWLHRVLRPQEENRRN